MSDKNPPEILKVSEVRDEYEYVHKQTCDKCGRIGTYEVEMQILTKKLGFPCDELKCKCKNCDAEKMFVFDITILFERYRKQFSNLSDE